METVSAKHIDPLPSKCWYAVYTPYRKEKAVCRNLLRKGVEAYVPVLKKHRRYTRKVKVYEIPLISHYVFVHIEEKAYKKVIGERDVIRFVGTGRKRSPIPEEEIQLLKRITGEMNAPELLTLQDWTKGSEVEVIGGALTGLKGTVREKAGKQRLLIELKSIGYTLSIEVPKKYLRILNRA